MERRSGLHLRRYWRAVGPISEGYSTWSVKRQGDKTLVYADLRYKVRFGPLGALMNVLILRRKIEQGLVDGLKGLKQHVETRELIGADSRAPVAA